MFDGSESATVIDLKDEDDMSSDSATAVPTQQSVKAYADSLVVSFADEEVPSGLINGSNTTYTLANTPVSGSVKLFLNGVRLYAGAGNDYTISGTTITMASAPDTGSTLLADYRY